MIKKSLVLFTLFAGLLVSSSLLMIGQQRAQALSAATFADKATFTSLNSNALSNVYQAADGMSYWATDATPGSFKAIELQLDGDTETTVTSALVGAGVSITSAVSSSTDTNTLFNQALGGTDQLLRTGSTTFVAEYAATASSLLVGQTVNTITLSLKKTGTAAGTATIAVFDNSGNTVYSFGTQDCAALTTSYQTFTYTGAWAGRTIANGDRIGIFFNGGSAGNECVAQYVNADHFDGTTNTIVATATGTQGAAAWTSQTTRELLMSLSFLDFASATADGSTTSIFENTGKTMRASNSAYLTTASLRSGSITIAAEKITASSALNGVTADSVSFYLSKTGSPTGTITAGAFDASGNLLHTFNTMDAASLTTSAALYTFTGSDYTFASTVYLGVQFAGGSVGNTVEIRADTSNAYDGTNTIRSTFTSPTWTDTSGADFAFLVSDTIAQEASAYIYANFGSAQLVGGLYVYWADNTKIPATVTLEISTDAISWTNPVTRTPTQAVGYDYLELDASRSRQYVRISVATWGSANTMAIAEINRLPTLTGIVALSDIEESGGTLTAYYVIGATSATTLYFGKINVGTGDIIAAQTFTAGGNVDNVLDVVSSKNKVYFTTRETGTLQAYVANRDTTSPATLGVGAAGWSNSAWNGNCIINDGAAAAQDVIYCIRGTATTTAPRMIQITGAGVYTDLGTIGAAEAATKTYMTWIDSTLAIMRFTQSSTTKTFTLDLTTGTESAQLYDDSWITLQNQQYEFDGTTRSAIPNEKAYYATADYQIAYLAGTGDLNDPDACYAETISNVTGTITCIDDSVYYRLSDTLIISGSGTTWTPRTITSANTMEITPYTENVGIPFANANYTVLNADVIKVLCDADYTVMARQMFVGNDDDCTKWRIVPESTDTIGRELPYTVTVEPVHYNPMTSYTVQLSAGGDLSVYFLTTFYDGKEIDTGPFDSGGAVGQRLAYGQCYIMQVEETSSGNVLQTGTLCANDITTKTISLSGIVIPDNWLQNTWSYSITRNKTNEENNGLLFALQKSVEPYNASIFVQNNFLPGQASGDIPYYEQWFNFTDVTGISIANVTGRASNETIHFTVYENGEVVLNAISYSDPDFSEYFSEERFGLIFGLPVAMIFPILTAAVFPKNWAHFGSIVTVAVVGIMSVFRIIELPIWYWGMIMPLLAFAVFVGFKRQ